MSGSGGGTWRGIGLRLGERRLVVRLDALREVRPMPVLARVPGAAPWLLGVGSANGRLLPVTDLGCFLTGASTSVPVPQVVVLERDGHLAGLAVDDVIGVELFERDDGDEAGALRHDCLPDSARAGGERWQVVDVAQLLADPGFNRVAAASEDRP